MTGRAKGLKKGDSGSKGISTVDLSSASERRAFLRGVEVPGAIPAGVAIAPQPTVRVQQQGGGRDLQDDEERGPDEQSAVQTTSSSPSDEVGGRVRRPYAEKIVWTWRLVMIQFGRALAGS